MKTITLNNDSDENIKAELLTTISAIIKERCDNQTAAAKLLGVDQPKISQIYNGKIAGFSLGRLLLFLIKLNCKIDLVITKL